MKWPKVTLKLWRGLGLNEKKSGLANNVFILLIAISPGLFAILKFLKAELVYYAFSFLFLFAVFQLFLIILFHIQNTSSLSITDKNLLKKFSSTVTKRDLDFVRNHDFAIPFKRNRIKFLNEIRWNWVGVEFEFEDNDLKENFHKISRKTEKFGVLLGGIVGEFKNDSNWLSTKIEWRMSPFLKDLSKEERERFIEKTEIEHSKKISEINRRAIELTQAFEDFIRLVRKKTPGFELSEPEGSER